MGCLARAFLLSATALAGLALAGPGLAQPRTAPPAANTVEELIVTAQKREESAQEVPIALTALSGETLERQGVTGFEDLSTRVPSLRFGSGVTGGENVITLRGIGSQNTTSGGDSPVAYNLDGVYLARTTSVDPEFFDIDRVEVLRGPQGTLYGRNSVGGSVNVITRRPTSQAGGHIDGLLGNYDAHSLRGWGNLPLVDNGDTQVLARLSGVWAEHDGYQKNLFNGSGATHDADGQDFWMLRGQLYFKFSDAIDLRLVASASENKDPVATKTQWYLAPARYVGAAPYLPDPREVRKNTPENFYQSSRYASGTLNVDVGFATLTSVTGYAEGKWKQSNDPDASELTLATNPYWTLDQFQWSEELRLASKPSESPVSWIVGGYFFREKLGQTFQFIDTGRNSASPFTDTFIFTNGGTYTTESYAGFGQADVDLGKTSVGVPVTLTAGVRYTHDNKHGFDFLNFTLPRIPFTVEPTKNFDENWSQTTFKLGANWRPSENLMLYANYSTGYLSGGGLVGNFPGIYQPEKVKAYEAGFKSRLMDNRLQFNAAAYHQKITDMQVFVQDITGSRIDNAGKAHVNGVELEAIATPQDGLRINAAATFTKAEYDEYTTINNRFAAAAPGCDPVTRLCDFSGNRLVQTPKYTFNLGAQYSFATGYGEVTPRVDLFWSGDLFFLSANGPLERQGAYSLVDLSVLWKAPGERWTVEAFVRNAGDGGRHLQRRPAVEHPRQRLRAGQLHLLSAAHVRRAGGRKLLGRRAMADAGWALTSLYHTVVNVRDLDESVAFYRLLGFDVLNDRRQVVWPDFVASIFGMRRAKGRGVLMVLPSDPNGPMIDLIDWVEPKAVFPDPVRQPEEVPRIIAFRTRNVHQAYAELSAKGVRFARDVFVPEEDLGLVGSVCCYDPNGNLIELIELQAGVRHSRANEALTKAQA